jgi:hypothetical protein
MAFVSQRRSVSNWRLGFSSFGRACSGIFVRSSAGRLSLCPSRVYTLPPLCMAGERITGQADKSLMQRPCDEQVVANGRVAVGRRNETFGLGFTNSRHEL